MKTIDILHLLQPGNVKARKPLNNAHRILLYTSLHWEWPGHKDRKDPAELSACSRNTLTSSRERHCAGEEMWRPHRSLQSLTTKFPERIFYPSRHSTLYPILSWTHYPLPSVPVVALEFPSSTKSYWQSQLFTHSEAVDMMIFYALTC